MDENEIYLKELAPDDNFVYLVYRPQKGTVGTTGITMRFLDYTFKTRSQTDYMYCKVPKDVLHAFLKAFDTQQFNDGKRIDEVFPIAKKRKVLQHEYAERWTKK